MAADITQLNFNVTFEVGFAIAREKRLLLTRHKGVTLEGPSLADLGLFDTLGYQEYENAQELYTILRSLTDPAPPMRNIYPLNKRAPLFLIEARVRTDPVTRMVSRVKKARLFYRSFDPCEAPRLSAGEAYIQVAQSFAVLLHLLPKTIADSTEHNLRAAFLAGLAYGFGKPLLLLQDGDDPVPIDYRDLVTVFNRLADIDTAIAEFAPRVTEALQEVSDFDPDRANTVLEKVTFGASAAENEFKELGGYYLETDQFQRARRGEVRLVVGRKGSGKTAIFVKVRDDVRRDSSNVVLDLRPDGYQLLKFKELVLRFLGAGALDHTVTAFWEYLLLLEVCHKLLEKDRERHTRDRRLFDAYRRLSDLYQADRYIAEGDFSERLSQLIKYISGEYQVRYDREEGRSLTQQQITELLYRHDVGTLRAEVVEYLRLKREIWLLFDNLDKGWPTKGLTSTDLVIVRALLEATRKIERQMQRRDVVCRTLVFLRNDVYELLVAETPDRGKEGRVALDWSDPDLLRELLRRRLLYSGMPDREFYELWRAICVSHVAGDETSEFLIERSLMRPRALIDLANHCRGYAVNLRHGKIENDDIRKGLQAFSSDIAVEVGYEIRDVLPAAEDVLYAFIDEPQTLSAEALANVLREGGLEPGIIPDVIDILLWYGVLGVKESDGNIVYIYSVNYEMPILRGIIRKQQASGVVYFVNPAFVPGLHMREDGDR